MNFMLFRRGWIALPALALMMGGVYAHSDDTNNNGNGGGMIVVDNPAPAPVPAPPPAAGPAVSGPSGSGGCGPFDPDCSRRLARVLSGIHLAPVQVEGGVRYGEGGPQGAVRFNVALAGLDVPVGDLRAVIFDAIYVPDAGGFRVRFTLADSEVMFFCKDEDGNTHPPLMGLFQNCRPDGTLGIGGTIGQVQWDIATQRVAARWAEVNMVLNFLRNGNSLDYLHHRLNAFLGTSLDTVWNGHTPGTNGGADTMLRLNMGITGMIRSEDNHWEVRGYAGYRPNITAWNDYSIELKTQVMYHLMLSNDVMANIGIDGQYTHDSVPSHSMGDFVSDRDQDSLYVGAMFGLEY